MTKRSASQSDTDTGMKQFKQDLSQIEATHDNASTPFPISTVLLHQGAEARVYSAELFTSSGPRDCVIKERFVKHYRHPTLDASLSAQRLRAEARLLLHCRRLGIDVPPVLLVDIPGRRLWLGRIGPDALTLHDWFRALAQFQAVPATVVESGGDIQSSSSSTPVAAQSPPPLPQIAIDRLTRMTMALGRLLARLHANHVTHGDLTMANILVRKATPEEEQGLVEPRLVLIDFGLASAVSHSATQRLPEEKAVDLYVFERALINALGVDLFNRIGQSWPQFATPEALMSCVLDAYRDQYASQATPLRHEAENTNKSQRGKASESASLLQSEAKANLDKLQEVRLRGRKRLMIG